MTDAIQPRRVLIVDDDEVDRLVVRRALARGGSPFVLEEAENAAEALRLLARGEFDCVLLDFNIPQGDGGAVLRTMRNAGLVVPVVMLTGHGDEQLAVELMKAGASDYLVKGTMTPEGLLRAVSHAISLGVAQADTRRAQAELEGTVERFGLAAESAALGTWDYNPVSGDLQWDERCRMILDVDAAKTSSYRVFVGQIHSDDRQRFEQTMQASLEAGGDGHYQIDYRVVWRDGSVRWVGSRGRAFFTGEGGARHASRFIGTVLDVTDHKRVEESLRDDAQVVETLQRIGGTLAAELNVERIVEAVTDEATKLTGAQFGAFFYNTLDEKGESLTLYSIAGVPREAFAGFPMPRNTQIFDPTFRATSVVRSADIRHDPRYGNNPPYHGMPVGHLPVASYLAVPVVSHGGDPIGGLFFGHAEVGVFTERHERLVKGIAGWATVAMDNARLYESEQRARADAERANRAKSEFLAAMSHDLRTPLNAIGGYAQLIDLGVHGPVSAGQHEALVRIQRAQEHLLSLISDILNYARTESGQLQLQMKDVAVPVLLASLEPLVQPQLLAKGLRYSVMPGASDVVVHTDSERAMQVLLNLLSNAVKFTPTGGAIDITWDADAERVSIHVQDTGRGIPAEKIGSIFEPFIQLDRTSEEGRSGVGLGLAISRELARAMKGDLVVRSAAGSGSTFTLVLPRATNAT
ncbi:MAG: ATP-binding protein [Gemmatimonadaceae bacterium]